MTTAPLTQGGGSILHAAASHNLQIRPTRRYRAQWLDDRGEVQELDRDAPASPLFDSAHSAFVRGTLITTTCGPIAIEDMLPGDRVVTAEHGKQTVRWIGSMTVGRTEKADTPIRLTRIMTDALGVMRPLSDLMVGPGARLLSHPRHLRARVGADPVLTPARAMADGMQIFEVTQRQSVTLYHLCLGQHAVITANGLATESFHPGARFDRGLDKETLRLFLSLFPHIESPRDFGPLAHLRLPLDMPDALDI
ncbi:Hint domain-containing protein [Roseovarius tibetensis]|uniref:Hint domain-containing protein n=1 Tax=Roseovarius tibetensis TaxID=2685897 RepID=UPI003D7FAC27